MNTLKVALVAILIAMSVSAARADAGDAALGIFGGLLLGEVIGQGRQQPAPPEQVIYVPQQAPAAAYRESPSRSHIPVEQRLGKLQELRDKGLITGAEHATARQEILNSL